MTDATVARARAPATDASGYAEADRLAGGAAIDPAAVGREAAAKAGGPTARGRSSPVATAPCSSRTRSRSCSSTSRCDSFSGLGLLEERSALCDRLGERVFDPKVSIADDPLDPRRAAEGVRLRGRRPSGGSTLIEDGVARGVVWDRATAARAADGVVAAPATRRRRRARVYGPMASALSVAPGEAESSDELAELVGDGIYVTRLHYLSIVDPREGVITGMTRDGTFRIRERPDRRAARQPPLHRLRAATLLAEVPGLTRGRTLVNRSDFYDERYPYGVARAPRSRPGAST